MINKNKEFLKTMSQQQVINSVAVWNACCVGCQTMKCNNSWKEILGCSKGRKFLELIEKAKEKEKITNDI